MIEFARTHIIGRAAGHSAVKAAAYRSGTKQHDERNGLTADYGFRVDEVAHSEILLPAGAPEALQDRSTLWNAIEFAEDKSTRRSTAQLAKDHIIALPRELNLHQQIELAREFAQTLTAQGVGVDLNVHLHSQDNPHAHLLTTTRIIDENGIGAKARHLNGGFVGGKKVVEAEQLRHTWANFQNQWCEQRGIDLFVTNNDGQWQPEIHNGPKTHISVLDEPPATREDIESDRAAAIQKNIKGLVDRVAKKKAVFTAHDLYRELHRHVSDSQQFANTKAILDKHLRDSGAMKSRSDDKQYFTVRETLDTELELKHMATELLKPSKSHGVDTNTRNRVIEKESDFLSEEQKAAVEHITGSERLSVVIGFAGTGKSTMLAAAAKSWKKTGNRVMGAALAGIAAEGLQHGANIPSRTIHSLLLRLEEGKEKLQRSDVLVIDEAGMIDSELMHRLISRVHKAGAKVVLVGDAEQLQPIQAGGPLRSLSEQGGFCEISTIRRQNSEEDRKATLQLAKGNAATAWKSYEDRGAVTSQATVDDAIHSLVNNAIDDVESGISVAVLAHANKHVNQINTEIRNRRLSSGTIKNEATFKAKKPASTVEKPPEQDNEINDVATDSSNDETLLEQTNVPNNDTHSSATTSISTENDTAISADKTESSNEQMPVAKENIQKDDTLSSETKAMSKEKEIVFKDETPDPTSSVILDIGVGDRILFRRNDTGLGVKNGSLGTVTQANDGQLEVKLDDGNIIEFDEETYDDIAHGYALTIHKSQGVTVDKSHVLASRSWDRHLAYVALSRHKDDLQLYVGKEQFANTSIGEAIGQARVQESAIDFARRHSIDIKDENGSIVLLDQPEKPKQEQATDLSATELPSGIGRRHPSNQSSWLTLENR